MRCRGIAPLGLGLGLLLAGCTSGAPGPTPPTEQPTSSTEETSASSVTPSITRDLPPEQRRPLAEIPPERLCELIGPDELSGLAFPVQPGQVREVGFDPPARGCTYGARSGEGSVLVGVQPEGYGDLGTTEVNLGQVPGSQTQHADDCTVFAGVRGATLQVVIRPGESEADPCESAQAVAQYALGALVR